jgi:hypothetical protein
LEAWTQSGKSKAKVWVGVEVSEQTISKSRYQGQVKFFINLHSTILSEVGQGDGYGGGGWGTVQILGLSNTKGGILFTLTLQESYH